MNQLSSLKYPLLIIGFFLAVFGGTIIIDPIVTNLWKRYVDNENKNDKDKSIDGKIDNLNNLKIIIGFVDRSLYFLSIIYGFEFFIPIWLGLRAAGEWNGDEVTDDPTIRYISFIGNGVSLIISVSIAKLLQYYTGIGVLE